MWRCTQVRESGVISARKSSFSSKLPIWYQLSAMLRADILAERISAGSRLASEVELAAQHHISVMPVRQAMRVLESEGLITRQRGRGTFVSDIVRSSWTNTTSLEALYSREFVKDADILERGIIAVPTSLAGDFSQAERLTFIRRLAFRDGQPWSYGTLYFRSEYNARISTKLLRRYPLYRIMKEECGVHLVRSHFDAQAIPASPEIASVLGIDPLSPVLSLHAVSFDQTGAAVGAFDMVFRSDPFVFSFETTHQETI